ncbi:MAG: SPOR domain-containing protein [Xanthomonadales bacterium]|nr:SPOR domain-containing protein [Xanthomonadales bacterium]
MFPRFLFLLLLALTIGGACWIAFAPAPDARDVEFLPEPGVARLVLLSERDGGAQPVAGSAAVASGHADDSCRSIGPFATQSDMRAAMQALAPHARRIQFRNARATQSRGYWVYLPAMKTREEALGIARALSAKSVRDYYVVTAGEQQNTVSLGLFREQANAERRRAEIVGMGFPAQVVQRTEELPVYWIDFAEAREHPLDWRARAGASGEVREQAIACF